ncbi:hypothetical protein F5880DRAFT_47283 [Lentinula raphanica]|nr:hypothetical protein F5880DRAFT_47283 [Lentinula raphanica]
MNLTEEEEGDSRDFMLKFADAQTSYSTPPNAILLLTTKQKRSSNMLIFSRTTLPNLTILLIIPSSGIHSRLFLMLSEFWCTPNLCYRWISVRFTYDVYILPELPAERKISGHKCKQEIFSKDGSLYSCFVVPHPFVLEPGATVFNQEILIHLFFHVSS